MNCTYTVKLCPSSYPVNYSEDGTVHYSAHCLLKSVSVVGELSSSVSTQTMACFIITCNGKCRAYQHIPPVAFQLSTLCKIDSCVLTVWGHSSVQKAVQFFTRAIVFSSPPLSFYCCDNCKQISETYLHQHTWYFDRGPFFFCLWSPGGLGFKEFSWNTI